MPRTIAASSPNLASLLDSLIAADVGLALFREPGGEPCLVLQEDGGAGVVRRLAGLDGTGFLMAPFAVSARTPTVFIRSASPVRGPEAITERLKAFARLHGIAVRPHAASRLPGTGKAPAAPDARPDAGYRQAFAAFHKALVERRFHKLVLSREQRIDGAFSPAAAFLGACAACPDAMASLVHTPFSGTWAGATPELLAAGRDGQWRTMALAGTRCAGDPDRWDDKNLEEQAFVADYIGEHLSRLCSDVREKGPYTVAAGRVSHLRTDFFFVPESLADTAAIVEDLHPTPAVCGLPKEEACMFIRNHEGHDRRYYTGFLGWWGGSCEAALYVNLRCMEMADDHVTLHAGGGILPASLLESEWRETCNKMATMRSLLQPED